MVEYGHSESTLINRTYLISLQWEVRNFSILIRTRGAGQKLQSVSSNKDNSLQRRVKMHLYVSYKKLLHMAAVTCPLLRILSILPSKSCLFYNFLSKVSLFTTRITTSILVFQYSMSLLRRQVERYFQHSIH